MIGLGGNYSDQEGKMTEKKKDAPWTFLTNHSHVLLCLADDSEMRMRDVAAKVGITERAVQRIISDLVESGYLQREREGRSNKYRIQEDMHLRHRIEHEKTIRDLIHLVLPHKKKRSR